MGPSRRDFLRTSAAVAIAPAVAPADEPAAEDIPITDTHQHLWDLEAQRLPWLETAPEVLRRSYGPADYREATAGLNVTRAIYMEVDVAPEQHDDEVARVVALCREGGGPTVAAVVGGRPADPDFEDYVARLREHPEVVGVRQVLHGSTPAGYCLSPEFVRGLKALGAAGLRFDLCMRPAELPDAAELAGRLPDLRFILDHCGNADPKAFRPRGEGDAAPSHDPEAWRRSIDALARREHVACKISGIVASAPEGWTPADLAPIVDHCLDAFGPDRVVFGGDWPVCLLGAPLRSWVEALRAIVARRPRADREKLFHANATRIYGLA